MKQAYIGNTKINKLYKGSELWCSWSSGGGDTPIEPSTGYVTDNLMICCDAYGKTSADSFEGFYDSINNKKFNLSKGSANYETNCLNLTNAYLLYGNGVSEYGSILKKSLKNSTFEIVFKCGSYETSWKTIITLGNYNPTPFSLRANMGRILSGNKVVYLVNNKDKTRTKIYCLSKQTYWNHIIISINNDNVAKIYVNGQYLKDYNVNSYDNNDSYYSDGLYFGYSNTGDSPLMSIGCFRYYNKALTENEVLQNFNYEQTITRVTTLKFPSIKNDDDGDYNPTNTGNPGEVNKGGIDSE